MSLKVDMIRSAERYATSTDLPYSQSSGLLLCFSIAAGVKSRSSSAILQELTKEAEWPVQVEKQAFLEGRRDTRLYHS